MVAGRAGGDDRSVQEQGAVGDPARSINAAGWSRSLGHDQAQLCNQAQRVLAIGGQRPVDERGRLLHEADLPAQIALTMDNLTAVVVEAGMAFADVVHLRVHTTDIAAYRDAQFVVAEHLATHGATTPVTVVEVACLAIPGMEVEMDGLAIRAGPSPAPNP